MALRTEMKMICEKLSTFRRALPVEFAFFGAQRNALALRQENEARNRWLVNQELPGYR